MDKNITFLGGSSLPGASIPILFQDSEFNLIFFFSLILSTA